jgi:uncharacterized protein YdhG (YjbR/CyaY superfamily)
MKQGNTNRVTNVDEYLARVPAEQRALLENLRKSIKAAAPKAVEVISYQIPSYKYHGMLVGFGAAKDFCSFFVMSATFLAEHADELKGFDTTKSAIHFSADKPLPASLVKKFVKQRIEENEATARSKRSSVSAANVSAAKVRNKR